MRLAEHFAIGSVGDAAHAPCSYMVGIHFGKFPNFILVRIVGSDIVRAVGKFFGASFICFWQAAFFLRSAKTRIFNSGEEVFRFFHS